MRRIFALIALALALASPTTPALAQRASVAITQVTFTATAGAYSAGQCLGGILTVPNMVRPQGPGGALIAGVSFLDSAHQTAANDAMTLLVFSAKPTGTYTDQANCQIAAADRPSFIGAIAIAAANCAQDQGPTTTVCTVTPNLPVNGAMPLTSSSIWVVPVVAATPTYGAITLYFNFMSTPFGN